MPLLSGIISLSLILLFGFLLWILFPKFLETPKYEVELSDSEFQLRKYDSFITTRVGTNGNQNEALRKGFRPLVRFIGAKERSSKKISMTVPVMQEKTSSEGNWLVSFSMPSKYSLNNLPKPTNNQLKQKIIPARLMAVIKFNGRANNDLLERKEKELRKWIAERDFLVVGLVQYYFYNDPTTPGMFRRNEVLLEVTK
tara:strand:- start:2417 stop:3010 length:594 start_codon:yes stop_codon:yes gene_type:complete